MMSQYVWIQWDDAQTEVGWIEKDAIKSLVPVKSLGWLVEETDMALTISSSCTGDGLFVDPLTIPKTSIKLWGLLDLGTGVYK